MDAHALDVLAPATGVDDATLAKQINDWQLSKPLSRRSKAGLLVAEEEHLHEIKVIWLQSWADGDPFDIVELYENALGYGRQEELRVWQLSIEQQLATPAAAPTRVVFPPTGNTDQFSW